MVLSILIIPKVKAITSEEVLYDKNGEEKVLKETLDELYTELNICYTKGDATSNDIVSGKSAYVKGKLVSGSMPVLQSSGSNGSYGHANATGIDYGVWSDGDTTKYLYLGIPLNTNTGNNNWVRKPESEVASALGITGAKVAQGQSIAGVSGTYTSDATASANQMLSGVTAYVKGNKITGTIGSKGATTYTPGTSNQTISAGQYLSGAQTIKGDGNLTATNIKSGVSIFGVKGSYLNDNFENLVIFLASTGCWGLYGEKVYFVQKGVSTTIDFTESVSTAAAALSLSQMSSVNIIKHNAPYSWTTFADFGYQQDTSIVSSYKLVAGRVTTITTNAPGFVVIPTVAFRSSSDTNWTVSYAIVISY